MQERFVVGSESEVISETRSVNNWHIDGLCATATWDVIGPGTHVLPSLGKAKDPSLGKVQSHNEMFWHRFGHGMSEAAAAADPFRSESTYEFFDKLSARARAQKKNGLAVQRMIIPAEKRPVHRAPTRRMERGRFLLLLRFYPHVSAGFMETARVQGELGCVKKWMRWVTPDVAAESLTPGVFGGFLRDSIRRVTRPRV